jgi:hypothetical protein
MLTTLIRRPTRASPPPPTPSVRQAPDPTEQRPRALRGCGYRSATTFFSLLPWWAMPIITRTTDTYAYPWDAQHPRLGSIGLWRWAWGPPVISPG